MSSDPHVPHLRVVLSGMAGSASLACWIVLLLPQLIEQWRVKSADGISIGFLVIWLLGDVTNLAGSLWAGLRPEVVLLAVWYCIADSLIMVSYFYYKRLTRLRMERKKRRRSSAEERDDPTAPLLNRRNSASRHRSSSSAHDHDDHHDHHHHHHHHNQRRDSLSSIVLETASSSSIYSRIILPIVFVLAAGCLGYFFSSKEDSETGNDDMPFSLGPQILGYTSAVLYLAARIPQIIQNHRRRSVFGLSLVFFIFSILGNVTYAAGILIYRTDSQWIKLYFSWLLGSLGTIVEDLIIFIQFYLYNSEKPEAEDGSAIVE
jgi:uncharacterized protein with PQ loop repeat